MSDIFLSYCRKDTRIMERLRSDLRKHHFDIWTDDDLEPGTSSWKKAIASEIRNAKCLVVILSSNAHASKWVNEEISYAEEHHIKIFPVLARDNEVEAIPFGLIESQWVDIRSQQYMSGVKKLISTVQIFLDSLDSEASFDRPKPKSVESPQNANENIAIAVLDLPSVSQPSLQELIKLFRFSINELELNQRGLVSKRQRKELLSTNFPVYIFLAVLMLLAFTTNGDVQVVTMVLTFFFFLIFLPLFYNLLFPRVQTITGAWKLVGTKTSPQIQIHDRKLKTTLKDKDLINPSYPGEFRAYYIGSTWPTNQLLSIEPWNE